MARPTPDLRAYLEAVSGGPVAQLRHSAAVEERLSLALRGRYRLETVRLFDWELTLAVESGGQEPATPAAYRSHVASIAALATGPVALVLSGVTSATRARLIEARVPFIVPGNQLFLPMCLVDLRERMTRPIVPRETRLGSVAQLVVLTHLQRQRMDVMSLAEAASFLAYSPMMLTKAKDELVASGLCTVRTEGRSLRLAFATQGCALWETALPRLASPVVRTHLVRFSAPDRRSEVPGGFVRAGVSALSALTHLAEDPLVTYAVSKGVAATTGPSLRHVELDDDAHARVEIWRYDPDRLSNDGRVDALSLYLTLRETADERVLGALEDLLENVRW